MKRVIMIVCFLFLVTGCKKETIEVNNRVYDSMPTTVVSTSEKKERKKQTTEVKTTTKKKSTNKRETTSKSSKVEKTTTSTKGGIKQKLMALKKQYPEGMSWTEEKEYAWHGGIWKRGFGCAAFAFLLSDALYGTKLAKKSNNFDCIEVGDIIRVEEDTHFVVVIEAYANEIVVAEGNYGGKVHWGRKIKRTEIGEKKDYILKRS